MKNKRRSCLLVLGVFAGLLVAVSFGRTVVAAPRPNVLFIAIDDLNDWEGCLGGHPQAKTPHMDRLARHGILFENAHCQAPICMPSRTSLLTGTYPHRNGVYVIEQKYHEAPLIKEAVTLPAYFKENGYRTMGCGKIFHRQQDHDDEENWHEWGFQKGWGQLKTMVGPGGASGLPNPDIFDFGPITAQPQEMGDYQVTEWVAERLEKTYDQPFFMAAGFNTPHLPLFTPEEYYQQYPLNQVQLPPVLPGDLDDLPPMGRKFTRYFDSTPMSHHNITRFGLWHKAVASYLACATFTDMCVGRVLDALEKSPHAGNTIIVLWSDHGFHIGEKMHWEKRSLWEESTRVPLIFSLPGQPKGNVRCGEPVELVDIYPTLVDLCGLPANQQLQGNSLVPLIENPRAEWNHVALTTHHPGNHAIRTERWRYIHYANGDEELYDHRNDPHEFTNLASDPEFAPVLTQLRVFIPRQCAPYAPRLPLQTYTQAFDWSKP